MSTPFSITSDPSFVSPTPEPSKRTASETQPGVLEHPVTLEPPGSSGLLKGGVLLPNYLLNPEDDIALKLFATRTEEAGVVPQYQGYMDDIERSVLSSGRRILQRGVVNHASERRVTGWMKHGVEMAKKAILMVDANSSKSTELLRKYFDSESSNVKSTFINYAKKAIVTMQRHIKQRGSQVVVYSGDNFGAFVYPGRDRLYRIFINRNGFNAAPDDFWMARLMIHESTHFGGAGDHGYISKVGVKGPYDKLNNADSLAYAMAQLAEHYVGNVDVESAEPELPVSRPDKPVDKPVQPVSTNPVVPQQVEFQLWINPLGGQRQVEVWNEAKENQGNYNNADLVLSQGKAFQRWLTPDGNKTWIEAFDPKKSYRPDDLASRYGVIVKASVGPLIWTPV